MTEKIPYQDPLPDELENRRDSLLLRIIELRRAVKNTILDTKIVSDEIDVLYERVQKVEGLLDIALFEQMFDLLEENVDSEK